MFRKERDFLFRKVTKGNGQWTKVSSKSQRRVVTKAFRKVLKEEIAKNERIKHSISDLNIADYEKTVSKICFKAYFASAYM